MPPTDPEAALDKRLSGIESQLSEIIASIRGAMGGPGLMQHVVDLQGKVAKLEAERAYSRGLAAAVAVVCSAVVSAVVSKLAG